MSAAYSSVLVVERDRLAKQALERALLREGLQTVWARTSAEAETALATRGPCLVILNPRMAPEDGWAVFRQLRRFQVPIIVVASKPDATIRRLALTLGADDCVVGEHGPEEVATRARFVLQRAPTDAATPTHSGELAIDAGFGGAHVGGRDISLTRTEYALLSALLEARGRVVPREQLVVRARAHASALPLARSIDAHVRALRRKLGDDPIHPCMLVSVRGFGYRLTVPTAPSATQLAAAAFDALLDPAFILDAHRRVKLLNHAAEALLGKSAEDVIDHLSCGVLLQCQASDSGPTICPALAALGSTAPQRAQSIICLDETPRVVEETVTRLSGDPAHVLMQLREHQRD